MLYLAAQMPNLSSIAITQFKNYGFSEFLFTEKVVGICGLNGLGKTNLLDAIYYLCFTKSYFTASDSMNVQFNLDGFRLQGIIDSNKIVCTHKGIGKKDFFYNDVAYEKFSEHIGKFPAVMIAPDDIELITGGSEIKRKFLDTTLSQIDAPYLQQLIQYNKILQQRNSLLKRFAEQGKKNLPLLDVLDEQLIQPGKIIYACRKNYTEKLMPLVQQFYIQIAGTNETITLGYESQLNTTAFEQLLLQVREKDCVLLRSNGGIHKDDISIQLNGQPFKSIASQGQRKSLLFALKLAEYQLIKEHKGFAPFLLLDDIFEKLDMYRMHNLLQWVCNENTGQVFITDTHKKRLANAFTELKCSYQLIEL